jgi:nicotinate-nucleotide adenylyltransferase
LPSKTAARGPLGILGGTFDPIHLGHLRTALELLDLLALDEVKFVPCREPPHRDAQPARGELRLELVRAAIQDEPRFSVDTREFRRSGPSYTVDTLASFRDEYPSRSLCLLLGMDAFLGLPQWQRWTELLAFAHIAVAHRPGWILPADGPLGEVLAAHRVLTSEALHAVPRGNIYITPVTQLEISATELRQALAQGSDPKYLVPDSVRKILLRSGYYR